MRTLVTGGAGFIGSNLTAALVEAGDDVGVIDDLSTGRRENLAGLEGSVGLTVGDIRDPDLVSLMDGVEVVFHLAALPSVARSVLDPVATNSVNVDGTLAVLQAARRAAVRRVVYASSSSVYGDTPLLPKHENMAVSPLSPYAASKLAGESYCRAFARVYGLETVALRFFNVFGPRQDPASEYAAVVPRFVTQIMAGSRPLIFGDGLQSRDFTFVGNVVDACMLAATTRPDPVGEALNVGCGDRTSLLELVAILNDIMGTDVRSSFAPRRAGDVRHSHASIEKARALLGYAPRVEVRDGLARTVAWFTDRTQTSKRTAPRPRSHRLEVEIP